MDAAELISSRRENVKDSSPSRHVHVATFYFKS